MPHLPQFGQHKNFTQKLGSVTFMCLLNPNFMQKIRNQYAIRILFSDLWMITIEVTNDIVRTEVKNNMPILRKRCYRQTGNVLTDGES